MSPLEPEIFEGKARLFLMGEANAQTLISWHEMIIKLKGKALNRIVVDFSLISKCNELLHQFMIDLFRWTSEQGLKLQFEGVSRRLEQWLESWDLLTLCSEPENIEALVPPYIPSLESAA